MKDWLAADQLRKDLGKRGIGAQVWLAVGIHCRLLILKFTRFIRYKRTAAEHPNRTGRADGRKIF
jgi:hypothetical protein